MNWPKCGRRRLASHQTTGIYLVSSFMWVEVSTFVLYIVFFTIYSVEDISRLVLLGYLPSLYISSDIA